jgi:sugar-specific transcriptional regulator TrmB
MPSAPDAPNMTDDPRAALEAVGQRFDLGEYEVEAYLTVLEHGRLTASEIADHTDIPQPRVYDTVRSLGDRGLVELRESRPMRVIAIDPGEAFADVETSLSELVDALKRRYTAPARDTEAVSLVKSRSTILRHFGEVIEAAEYELALSLTPDLLARFEDDLAAVHATEVDIELLVTPAAKAPDPEEFDYGSVCTTAKSRRGITTPVMAVADGEYSVYATQDALGDRQDRYGVIFNRSALGFLVSGFFGTVLWTTAEETLHTDESLESLPRRYASVRRCVKGMIARDGDFYVTVEGRDVQTGEPRVLEGWVADVVLEESEEVAGFTVETDDGLVEVGGQVAAYEDVEAHEIELFRQPPA